MIETAHFKLPLLQPSQAQKHVTVNEALLLLDGLAQLRLASRSLVTPPASSDEGDCYAVPDAATDAWDSKDGKIAIWINGGWVFVTPQIGWRAWVLDESAEAVFKDGAWIDQPLSSSLNGAAAVFRTTEVLHDVVAGSAHDVGLNIPSTSMVFAVGARVTQDLTGSLSSWELGTAGAEDRFGSGMGLPAGSFSTGVLGSPLTYYTTEPLRLSPVGGQFSAGQIRIALHYLSFEVPGA